MLKNYPLNWIGFQAKGIAQERQGFGPCLLGPHVAVLCMRHKTDQWKPHWKTSWGQSCNLGMADQFLNSLRTRTMTFVLACLIMGSRPMQNRYTEICPFNLGPSAQKLFLHTTIYTDIVNGSACRPVSESHLTFWGILFSDSLFPCEETALKL